MKLLFSLLSLLLSVLLWNWYGRTATVETADAFAVQVAVRSTISEVVNATGVIKPRNGAEVRVGSRISGVLELLHVDVGDAVHSGQLLAELDDRDLQVTLLGLRARVRELEAQHVYSQELLARNRSAATLADAELARLKTEVEMNAARLDQARGALATEELRLSWTRVTAPISGTIASVSTQQGETIAASFAAPTFLTIIDLTRLEIQAYVDESDIGKISPGQPVRFTVDTYPGAAFAGQVRTIYPKAEIVNNVVNYIVIVDIAAQPEFLLRPEMTAHLQFVLREVADTMAVPRSALFGGSEGYYLMLQLPQERWERRPVEVGIVTPASVEITAGLTEGSVFISDRQTWLAANPNNPGD